MRSVHVVKSAQVSVQVSEPSVALVAGSGVSAFDDEMGNDAQAVSSGEVGTAEEHESPAASLLTQLLGLSEPQLRNRCTEAGLSRMGSRIDLIGRLVKFHV